MLFMIQFNVRKSGCATLVNLADAATVTRTSNKIKPYFAIKYNTALTLAVHAI